jgi:hypothetical protein
MENSVGENQISITANNLEESSEGGECIIFILFNGAADVILGIRKIVE